MASKFALRDDQTQDNPFAARLYGLGITQGRLALYDYNGSQTTLISILAQGSRFRGDLPCSQAIRVLYSGFDLAEFDSLGNKQWRFHQGKVTTPPVYYPLDSVDTTANTIHRVAHPYLTGDLIAFHGRGVDAKAPAPVIHNVQYMAYKVDADNYKVLAQSSGTPDLANTVDLLDAGTNLDRVFSYKADAFYWDADQGRPEFFPTLNFTFAGLSYIEVRLPVDLSNGTDEPTNLKILMEGKLLQEITLSGGQIVFDTPITAEPNNALVAIDALHYDQGINLTRFGQSWVDWRDRCDEIIDWVGGNDAPQEPAVLNMFTHMSFDADNNILTKTGGTDGTMDRALTDVINADNASCEFTYTGGDLVTCYFTDQSPPTTHKHGINIEFDTLSYNNNDVLSDITGVAISDKIRISYESGQLVIYKNSIPMPAVDSTYAQRWTTNYYISLGILNNGDHIDHILIAPSGNESLPREIERFRGHYVATQPSYASDLFETMILLAPGTSWADIDGKIEIATIPDRAPCFTFDLSNTESIQVRRKSVRNTSNFWRYLFRDSDDLYLQRKFVVIDRKARRLQNGGRLLDAGLQQFSVLNQSQMERIGESIARLSSDLDIGFTVAGFLDSLAVCKGSFVHIIDPVSGYDADNPALVMVIEDRLVIQDVERKVYECQIITPDYYSDSDHSALTPQANSTSLAKFHPPIVASGLTLAEHIEPLPDGQTVSSIAGDVDFTMPIFSDAHASRARIYRKVFIDQEKEVTFDHTTNQFTISDPTLIPAGDVPLSFVSTAFDLPTGATIDDTYFVVNVSGSTFKLATTVGGTASVFTTNGSALRLYNYLDWDDTLIDVYPAVNEHGTFEIIPARKSYTVVRAVTFSAGDTSLAFSIQTTAGIQIVGTLMLGSRLATSDGMTRRGNAVSSTGVLSASSAEFNFVRPQSNRLMQFLTEAHPSGLDETEAYAYSIPENVLIADGDTVVAQYIGVFAGVKEGKRLRAKVAGQIVFDSNWNFRANDIALRVTIIRLGQTAAVVSSDFISANSSKTDYTLIDSEIDFSSPVDLVLTLQADANETDLSMKAGVIDFEPAN